jgi:hypothetical protein
LVLVEGIDGPINKTATVTDVAQSAQFEVRDLRLFAEGVIHFFFSTPNYDRATPVVCNS